MRFLEAQLSPKGILSTNSILRYQHYTHITKTRPLPNMHVSFWSFLTPVHPSLQSLHFVSFIDLFVSSLRELGQPKALLSRLKALDVCNIFTESLAAL